MSYVSSIIDHELRRIARELRNLANGRCPECSIPLKIRAGSNWGHCPACDQHFWPTQKPRKAKR